ncbi:MAG: hypothetical protein H6700_09745 [Myxococcales bacterium]|nr:hypothetical protein [Myxococcales bacterium]
MTPTQRLRRGAVAALAALLSATPACGDGPSDSGPEDGDTSGEIGDDATGDVGADTNADAGTDAGLDADDADGTDTPGDTAVDAVADTTPPLPTYDPHPEPPSILRDVALINDDAQFTVPYIPGHRTTMDGRIGIRVQGGPPGPEPIQKHLSFYLFVPEALEDPVMPGPPGARILPNPEPFDVVFEPAFEEGWERTGHHAICDATQEMPVPGEHTNPYACGPDLAHDCYDITVISSTSPGLGIRIWGTPVTVEVENPKTPQARIVDARAGASVAGAEVPFSGELTEPAVTIDGRLLTARLGRAPRAWTNPNTGETITRQYDLAYSVLPPDADPCDVTGWTTFHPMSHAPYDPDMIGHYGIAAYPFRDSEGQPIADGEDLGGTYPWVDREASNVFMAAIPGRVIEQSTERYPRRCVVEGCESYEENNDWDRGFMIAGLWTHGKLVMLDGMMNNMDWAVGVTPASHYWVDLYRTPEGDPVPVRFGAGRFIDSVRNAGGPYPPGYTHNANILDSMQNLPNHHRNAVPVTPRDVVWFMSTGVGTDEVAFDDFIDVNAFIVSNMHASVTSILDGEGHPLSLPKYWNGDVRDLLLPVSVGSFYILDPDQQEEIHVQNAATTLHWKVPAFGRVDAGTGRIEPVASGGIQGKGFWLSGTNAIRYEIPAQDRLTDNTPWYVGVFFDARTPPGERRALFTFPDGTGLHVDGARTAMYVRGDEVIHTVTLPGADGWAHLGLQLDAGNRRVTLLFNGLPIDRFDADEPLMGIAPGELVVGATSTRPGARGWIDDFAVFASHPNAEVACNYARGTLVTAPDGSALAAEADRYPAWAHTEVGGAAGLGAGARVACYHDYGGDYRAHLRSIPDDSESLRATFIFPEGPLRYGEPRPDSTGNQFCLSCHTTDSAAGLSIAALALDPGVPAEQDRRRQPMQPPRRVFGNIPAGWIPPGVGPGSPDEPSVAPPEGVLIDRWVLEHTDR